MSKYLSAFPELEGKSVRFFLGGGDRGYVQGPVKKVDGNMIHIMKDGEIKGTMHSITLNADHVLFFEYDMVTRMD